MKLTFITLTTGNVMQYDRADTADSVVANVHTMLRKGGILLKGWSVVVHQSTAEQAKFDLLLDNVVITRCWLCLADRVAEQVWLEATVNSNLPLIMVEHRPQDVPWLAIGMAISVIDIVKTRPERLLEAAEAELCVAWALAEHPRE